MTPLESFCNVIVDNQMPTVDQMKSTAHQIFSTLSQVLTYLVRGPLQKSRKVS